MDILRLNIEALSDGSVVLLGTVEVRQPASDNLEERITEIIKASGAIEQIRAEVKADLRAELGEVAVARDRNDESRAAGVESCLWATRRSGKGAIPEHRKYSFRDFSGFRIEIKLITSCERISLFLSQSLRSAQPVRMSRSSGGDNEAKAVALSAF
jgi:hypothetical protein